MRVHRVDPRAAWYGEDLSALKDERGLGLADRSVLSQVVPCPLPAGGATWTVIGRPAL